ncbi:MAG: DUF58 domain-containing protein [bacterium]|nr:DUF58 domain-containing protein [bacterium]
MHASPFKGFSIEFADHREYAPGDDPRHIDWRVYAKADRFFVKEYEVETNVRTYLLLDGSGSMAYPEQPAGGRLNKWDYAATVTLSLAYLLVAVQNDGAGLILFDERIRVPEAGAPVSTSRAALTELVETIERHTPTGRTDVKVPLAELADRVSRRGMTVIISDLLTDVESTIEGLSRFQGTGQEVLLLHVLDHDEIEFPFTDRTLFEGMEEPGVEVLTDPQALRAGYRRAVQRFIERIRGACLDRQISYELVSTAEPVEQALARFLAARMHYLKARS